MINANKSDFVSVYVMSMIIVSKNSYCFMYAM